MEHRFVIDNILKEEREERENKLRYRPQTTEGGGELRAQIVKINRAIFALLKDARK